MTIEKMLAQMNATATKTISAPAKPVPHKSPQK